MKRFGSATGSRSLRDGKGAVSTESQAMKKHPYRFFSRYGDTPGTNPEELVVAAHAACFNDAVRWNARNGALRAAVGG